MVTRQEVRALLEPDEPDYATAAARLGPDALPHLRALLGDPAPGIAAKAASLAGAIGGDAAGEVLEAAARSGDPVVRVAAAGAAAGLPADRAAGLLSPLVADEDVGVQKTALRSAPPELPTLLRDAIEQVRSTATSPTVRDLAAAALASEGTSSPPTHSTAVQMSRGRPGVLGGMPDSEGPGEAGDGHIDMPSGAMS